MPQKVQEYSGAERTHAFTWRLLQEGKYHVLFIGGVRLELWMKVLIVLCNAVVNIYITLKFELLTVDVSFLGCNAVCTCR